MRWWRRRRAWSMLRRTRGGEDGPRRDVDRHRRQRSGDALRRDRRVRRRPTSVLDVSGSVVVVRGVGALAARANSGAIELTARVDGERHRHRQRRLPRLPVVRTAGRRADAVDERPGRARVRRRSTSPIRRPSSTSCTAPAARSPTWVASRSEASTRPTCMRRSSCRTLSTARAVQSVTGCSAPSTNWVSRRARCSTPRCRLTSSWTTTAWSARSPSTSPSPTARVRPRRRRRSPSTCSTSALDVGSTHRRPTRSPTSRPSWRSCPLARRLTRHLSLVDRASRIDQPLGGYNVAMKVVDVQLSTGLRMQMAESGERRPAAPPGARFHRREGGLHRLARSRWPSWAGMRSPSTTAATARARSRPTKSAYSFDLLAADALALADDRWGPASRFVLLGHSMGGMVAQVIAHAARRSARRAGAHGHRRTVRLVVHRSRAGDEGASPSSRIAASTVWPT